MGAQAKRVGSHSRQLPLYVSPAYRQSVKWISSFISTAAAAE